MIRHSLRENMREVMLYVVAAVVLGSAVIGVLDRRNVVVSSDFYAELRTFVLAGPRNTARAGYNLCLRVAHLENQHHETQNGEGCRALYFSDTSVETPHE